MACTVLAAPALARGGCCPPRRSAAAAPLLAPRPARCQSARAHAGLGYARLDSALHSAEASLDKWMCAAVVGADHASRGLQAWFVRLLVTAQRLLRWVRLAATALALSLQQQQQVAFAASGSSGSGAGDAAAPAPLREAAPASPQQQQQPTNVIELFSAATTGAVEQLRHTLMDASQGIESKMSVIERTASSVQGTLFQAAQAHSEAVRSNPQMGMWKQPSVGAVLSEEERLREAVFAQVFAELMQKDNADISFNAGP